MEPLDIALAWLVVRAFPDEPLEPRIVADVLAIVSREVLEITSSSFAALKAEVDAVVPWLSEFLRPSTLGPRLTQESECDACGLDALAADIRYRVGTEDAMEQEPIDRRSLLGLFLRRVYMGLCRLSFDETSFVATQVGAWCRGEGTSSVLRLNRKLAMINTLETREKAMQEYQSALASGDHSRTLEALRRFHDYSSTGHQHTLLQLAAFHQANGEDAAPALSEAVRVARAEGDRACLDQARDLSVAGINMDMDMGMGMDMDGEGMGSYAAWVDELSAVDTPLRRLMYDSLDLPAHLVLPRALAMRVDANGDREQYRAATLVVAYLLSRTGADAGQLVRDVWDGVMRGELEVRAYGEYVLGRIEALEGRTIHLERAFALSQTLRDTRLQERVREVILLMGVDKPLVKPKYLPVVEAVREAGVRVLT